LTNFDGYAPIFAYIGTEGYLCNAEFREGKQHCQSGTPEFLAETIASAKQMTKKPLLRRFGNDAHALNKLAGSADVDDLVIIVDAALLQTVPNIFPCIMKTKNHRSLFLGYSTVSKETAPRQQNKKWLIYDRECAIMESGEDRDLSRLIRRTGSCKGK